jgi:sugar phosphate isomerase/epimerase
MQIGVCGDPALARIAREAGFDFFEWSVAGLLHPREDEAAFTHALSQVLEAALPCPVLNCFIPGDLPILGPDRNLAALQSYIATAMSRAEQAGIDRIVFGSGAARRCPDGFPRPTAWAQLVEFSRLVATTACNHGVTVVVEPLNTSETNTINSVPEGAALVHEVDHPSLRLLVDGYHWGKESEPADSIIQHAGLLRHAHIATVADRRPPCPRDDCAAFLNALEKAGYRDRLSIEARIDNPQDELPRALDVIRKRISNLPSLASRSSTPGSFGRATDL